MVHFSHPTSPHPPPPAHLDPTFWPLPVLLFLHEVHPLRRRHSPLVLLCVVMQLHVTSSPVGVSPYVHRFSSSQQHLARVGSSVLLFYAAAVLSPAHRSELHSPPTPPSLPSHPPPPLRPPPLPRRLLLAVRSATTSSPQLRSSPAGLHGMPSVGVLPLAFMPTLHGGGGACT